MTETEPSELPLFPTADPEVLNDPEAAKALFKPVLTELAAVVDVDQDRLGDRTPCTDFTVAQLRQHVLAWLQFFTQALNDPDGKRERIDPETWELADDQQPSQIVIAAAADIDRAIDNGVADQVVVMSQARMTGGGVLAMALGEYLVHGWDLATATGQPWTPSQEAAEPALEFLRSTVAPEHRGPDSQFFDEEILAPEGASPFEKLLCFGGRQP